MFVSKFLVSETHLRAKPFANQTFLPISEKMSEYTSIIEQPQQKTNGCEIF